MNSELSQIDGTAVPLVVADGASARLTHETAEFDNLLVYLLILRRWSPLIAVAAAAAMIAAGLISKFAMTKWYQATAVLRPVAQPSVESRLAGILGGFGGAVGEGGIGLGALAPDAQQYITILNSFAFNIALADRHHLVDELLEKRDRYRSLARSPRWTVYRILQGRFSCQYSMSTGNLTMSYQDPDPSKAERVLGFFVADLRDQLRRQELRDAAAAIDSLQGEIKLTSDTLLQQQLYELMAKQIEHEKLAQVEADFAFAVVDPPVASDRPSKPKLASNCLLAGLVAALGLGSTVVALTALSGKG